MVSVFTLPNEGTLSPLYVGKGGSVSTPTLPPGELGVCLKQMGRESVLEDPRSSRKDGKTEGGVELEGQALGSEAWPWAWLVPDASGCQSGLALLMGPRGMCPPVFTGHGRLGSHWGSRDPSR